MTYYYILGILNADVSDVDERRRQRDIEAAGDNVGRRGGRRATTAANPHRVGQVPSKLLPIRPRRSGLQTAYRVRQMVDHFAQ